MWGGGKRSDIGYNIGEHQYKDKLESRQLEEATRKKEKGIELELDRNGASCDCRAKFTQIRNK